MYEIVDWLASRGTQIVLTGGLAGVLTYIAVMIHRDERDGSEEW